MDTKKIVSRFNQKANEWLVDLRMIDEAVIQIKPNGTSWSLAELYDHILRVGRSYQIPNLKKSISASAIRKKRKNKYGIAIFNFGLRRKVEIKMEKFPQPLVEAFTPIKRNKSDLVKDFLSFIKEVNALQEILEKSDKTNKHYHGLFGDLTTKEWFSVIELHMWHHDKQREKIKRYLATNELGIDC